MRRFTTPDGLTVETGNEDFIPHQGWVEEKQSKKAAAKSADADDKK